MTWLQCRECERRKKQRSGGHIQGSARTRGFVNSSQLGHVGAKIDVRGDLTGGGGDKSLFEQERKVS